MSIGIDYSMTCPAACYYVPDDVRFWYSHGDIHKVGLPLGNVAATFIAPNSVSKRAALLAHYLVLWIRGLNLESPSAWIEDYAFAATGRVFHIGENTGILKHFLDDASIEFTVVPPTVVKKFATGKGNADKHKMTDAFLLDYPPAVEWISLFFPRYKDGNLLAKSPLSDLADAYWIAKYGAAQGR